MHHLLLVLNRNLFGVGKDQKPQNNEGHCLWFIWLGVVYVIELKVKSKQRQFFPLFVCVWRKFITLIPKQTLSAGDIDLVKATQCLVQIT